MRHRCKIDETMMISKQTLMIINVFTVLISDTLMFYWWFNDEFLKKNIDATLMRHSWFRYKHYWYLMFLMCLSLEHWCFFDASLMISIQTLLIFNVFNVLVSGTLMFHWCFIDDSLMISWGCNVPVKLWGGLINLPTIDSFSMMRQRKAQCQRLV